MLYEPSSINVQLIFWKVFLNLIYSGDNLTRLLAFMEIFTSACGAAKNIFAVIDRQSNIDSMNNGGKSLDSSDISGHIEFNDIHFNYPSRPDVEVLINSGKQHMFDYIFGYSIDFGWAKLKNRSWPNCCTGGRFGQWEIHLLASFATFLRSDQWQHSSR